MLQNDAITEDSTENTLDNKEDNNNANPKDKTKLYKAFKHVLQLFNKNMADSVLFANIDVEAEGLTLANISEICKKIGLSVEMRRVNLLDITTGPAILTLANNNYVVLEDGNNVFNPDNQTTQEFTASDYAESYNGYSLFFYEEDLSVTGFIKRTSFLFSSLSQFKIIFVEILLLSFFINIFVAVSPFYTMIIYDKVVPNAAFSTLFVLSTGMITVYLFDVIFKMVKAYLTEYVSLSIGNRVDNELMDKLLRSKTGSTATTQGAKTSLFKELSMVREFYFSRFIPLLIDIPFLALFFVILLFISPWIALVPLIFSILIFTVNVLMQVPMQNSYKLMAGEDQGKNSLMIETLAATESLKTFNAIGKMMFKWRRVLDKSYRVSFSYNMWVSSASNISMFFMNLVTVLVVIVGVFEISSGVMTMGGLIASSTLSSRIMSTVITFSGMVVRYRSVQGTLRSLEKTINAPTEDNSANFAAKGPFKGNIVFKEVGFFYPALQQPILNKCSFNIKSGSKVAIIGKTGAGKSTITRLLLGLDFANRGQIFIDDIEINNIHISELRANIGFMPQKSQFITGTVRENIMLNYQGEFSEEKYKKACEMAGVDLITSLSSKGDDMMIQEQGKNLSGGQQQIIALARAIINNPNIIIMDEPTNGMDVSLEGLFMEKTKEFIKDKTFILITHKPSQLSLVDNVIVVDNSTVVMQDTKDNVLKALSKNQK